MYEKKRKKDMGKTVYFQFVRLLLHGKRDVTSSLVIPCDSGSDLS